MPLPSGHLGVPLSSSQQKRWEELFLALKKKGLADDVAAPITWKNWEKEYRIDRNKNSWKRIVSQGVQT